MTDDVQSSSSPEYGGGAPHAAKTVREELTEPARMNALGRIGAVFVSPGEVFEDVRRSPRDWWLPMILLLVVGIGVGFVIQVRLDLTPQKLAAATVDTGLQQQGKTRKDLSEAERDAVKMQEEFTAVFFKFMPAAAPVFVAIFFGIISGFYYLALMIAQCRTTFFRVLSVCSYAYFVPNVVKSLLQGLLAFLKDPSTVDAQGYMEMGGILTASPAMLVSSKANPGLWTFLSYLDLFSIWFLVLLAIGLSIIPVKRASIGKTAVIAALPYVVIMLLATAAKALMG